MTPLSLETRRMPLPDGRSASALDWNGETVLVDNSASNALALYMALRDGRPSEREQAIDVISMMFVDPDAAYLACDYSMHEFGRLVRHVARETFGIVMDPDAAAPSEPDLFDLEQDAPAIRTSLRMAYGIDWDEARDVISWGEFLALMASMPIETPMGARMYYRNPENRPKPGKHNREQVAEFDRLAKLLALEEKGSHDDAGDANRAMNDVALSLCAIA